MKAGLLPRLSGRILWIYAEASEDGTEARLLKGLRERCPGVPAGASLTDTLVAVRKGGGLLPGRKVLLVLDHFERWLRAHRGKDEEGLVAALRQCDGEHLQALAVVRDDSWVAASRFVRDLEDRIVEGGNTAVVNAFDPARHARRVLEALGGRTEHFPMTPSTSRATRRPSWIERSPGSPWGARSSPVRLSMFAATFRRRAWVPSTLELLGTNDLGVSFLEETFVAEAAPPEWKRHRAAACSVLAALLPGPDANLRDGGRTFRELSTVSGNAARPEAFEAVMQVLVSEVGLVTRIGPDGIDDRARIETTEESDGSYRLAHDCLITPLKEWLNREVANDPVGPHEMTTEFRGNNGTEDLGRLIDVNSANEGELRTLPRHRLGDRSTNDRRQAVRLDR